MTTKISKASVAIHRQETQYTCMASSLASALKALDKPVTEAAVNKVMGASPMRGASWEDLLSTAQYFGMRATLVVPCTLGMLKEWTDAGTPVVIAWNPHGRPWSHASVVFDVTKDDQVHIMDPNCPDPDTSVVIMHKSEFYKKWMEPLGDTMIVRRPACAIEREVSKEGRQMKASVQVTALDRSLEALEAQTGLETDIEEIQRIAAGEEDDRFAQMAQDAIDNFNAAKKNQSQNKAAASGLYGHTKKTQTDCLSATKRLQMKAAKLARALYTKDAKTADFLSTHVARTDSMSARVLMAEMANIGPKFAGKQAAVVAAKRKRGLYGYPHKTATLSLEACRGLRSAAGSVANDLHARRNEKHGAITGFFSSHTKEAGCSFSGMLGRYYPDSTMKLASEPPTTLEGWLNYKD